MQRPGHVVHSGCAHGLLARMHIDIAGQDALRTPKAWSKDGKTLYYTTRTTSPSKLDLWALRVDGGEPHKIDLGMEFSRVAPDPEGKRFAVTVSSQGKPEYWVMENLLPPAKGK